MIKPIAIIAGEPNSISSEIIFKAWKLKAKFLHKPFFVIGNIKILNLQKKKLKYKIKIKEITNNFVFNELNDNSLPVYNVNYDQSEPFKKISKHSNNYIFNCFKIVNKLIKSQKILGFVNCPISKESLFKNKDHGITEFLAKKSGIIGKEVMLIFNKKLSVSPITTHIPLKQVNSKIKKEKIIQSVKTINNFYRYVLKKNAKFGILGLNPHSFSSLKKNEEKEIITKAIKDLKKLKINVEGPLSPDSSFIIAKKNSINVLIGMYHDQVLTTFKTMYNFDAINITLGLPYIRISPDHGTATNIMGKKLANPKSLIEAIKFFNYIK